MLTAGSQEPVEPILKEPLIVCNQSSKYKERKILAISTSIYLFLTKIYVKCIFLITPSSFTSRLLLKMKKRKIAKLVNFILESYAMDAKDKCLDLGTSA